MKQMEINWSTKKATVIKVSVRQLEGRVEEEEEYAVISTGTFDDYERAQEKQARWKKKKSVTMMCFEAPIFRKLLAGEEYSFIGKISFGVGNTFLCIEKAFDELGIPVTSGNSIPDVIREEK